MKLRNKKTGEIREFNEIFLTKIVKETNTATSEYVERSYATIAELNEEWEDYKSADPLIKDEKIRKAVRAWADLYDYKFVTHRFYTTTTGHRWSLLVRETQEICLPDLDGLEESKDYTIAELCGEEEE